MIVNRYFSTVGLICIKKHRTAYILPKYIPTEEKK